jgi:hypothetical protein
MIPILYIKDAKSTEPTGPSKATYATNIKYFVFVLNNQLVKGDRLPLVLSCLCEDDNVWMVRIEI